MRGLPYKRWCVAACRNMEIATYENSLLRIIQCSVYVILTYDIIARYTRLGCLHSLTKPETQRI